MAGVAQPNISGSQLEDIPIPLPPLAEQKRIAAILDQADVLRVKRRTALARLDALVQAVFLEMFGDPVTNPMGWEEKTLGDVIYFAKDGPHVSPIYVDKGIPFLSTRNIRAGQVIWEEMKYISRQDAEVHWEKCKPENGDILYTKGGTTGLAKAIDFHDEIAIWVHIALLKTMHEKVHPLWLENMLNSQYCYTQSQRYTRGIANRDLGLNRMVNIKIYTPPLLLQKQFAEHVAKIDKQRQHMQQSVGTLDLLFYSLQQRAFRGEL
jgi:type I restriction enzyme S subunit